MKYQHQQPRIPPALEGGTQREVRRTPQDEEARAPWQLLQPDGRRCRRLPAQVGPELLPWRMHEAP